MPTADASPRPVERPCLVEGTSAWVLFPATRHQDAVYVLGSPERDRYLAVPAPALRPITKVLEYFDGTRSVSEIQQQAGGVLGVRVNVSGLCEKLDEAGLLTSAGERPGDVTRLSAAFVDTTLPRWALATAAIPRAVTVAVGVAAAAVCLWAAGLVVVQGVPRLAPGALPGSRGAAFLTALVVYVSAIGVHELAHVWAATFSGLRSVRLKVLLYLGFLPLVAVKFRGLYTLPREGRLLVWGAGIFANLTLAALVTIVRSAGVLPEPYVPVADTILLVNGLVALFNLCPFLPTDGYYIACTLLRQFNVRTRAYFTLADLVRLKRGRALSPWVVIYLVATIAVLAAVLVRAFGTLWYAARGLP